MIRCFKCSTNKDDSEFSLNRMKYQIKAYKGKCFMCKDCQVSEAVKRGGTAYYDFEEKTFKVIELKTKQEAVDFFNSRYL